MLQGNIRKMTIAFLVVYTLLMLYFLYFGFDRIQTTGNLENRYELTMERIPLSFPTGWDSFFSFTIWFFHFANFAAFIPYGILIPLLYPWRFIRFVLFFFVSITALEAIQMMTRLGAFDVADIFVNTLGAVIGFWSQRLVSQRKDTIKGMVKIGVVAILLSLGTLLAVEGINKGLEELTKVEAGREIGLHELAVNDGSVIWDEHRTPFEVGHEKIEPAVNVFSRENPSRSRFTYHLDGKYLTFSGYTAIPEDIKQGTSTITFTIDGAVVSESGYEASETERNEGPSEFELDLQGAKELTIEIKNDDQNPTANLLLWDAVLTEIKK